MAPSAQFQRAPTDAPCRRTFVLTRADPSPLSTIIAVIEMSQTKWLVAAVVPGVERQPLKKLEADKEALLKLLQRWRNEANRAGREIKRIVVAYEAGRDGYWLARWLLGRDVETYVIPSHEHCGVTRTPAREDRSPRYGTPDAGLSRMVARRETALQHGGGPDNRGGGREAAEP